MLDLFGEIPVTWPEIWDWVESVAKIPRTSWRARYYAEHWNVPDKIRSEKLKQHAALYSRHARQKPGAA